jgi:hypothetical protein
MKIKNKGIQAPIISDITFYHNATREDKTIGDYIVINFLGGYKTQVINVDSKVDVNCLDKNIKLKKNKDSDVVCLYDIKEQEGFLND